MNPFYVVDPDTGELVDPVTGEPAEMNHVSEDSDVLPDPADDGADGPPAEE